jgi:hypothetical protein
MQCARHPKVETALSCGKCGTPICPDCSVVAPVGMRCRDCASMRSSPLYQVRPERFALAAVAGVAAGTLAGFVLQYVGFFILFVAPMIGGFLGEVILRATGRKRGARLEFLAGASVVIGCDPVGADLRRFLPPDPAGLARLLPAGGRPDRGRRGGQDPLPVAVCARRRPYSGSVDART